MAASALLATLIFGFALPETLRRDAEVPVASAG
jgi:hypothetical protein